MTQHEGFLVVQTHPDDLTERNPRYQGVDRTPPFSITKFEEGHNDSLLFGDATDDAGLIASASAARRVKTQFRTLDPRDQLEIIFVRTCNGASPQSTVPSAARLLGFDVAGSTRPFYSIVSDFGPEPELEPFRIKLNAAGLFDSAADASAYLDFYRQHQFHDYDLPFDIWQVWLPK